MIQKVEKEEWNLSLAKYKKYSQKVIEAQLFAAFIGRPFAAALLISNDIFYQIHSCKSHAAFVTAIR